MDANPPFANAAVAQAFAAFPPAARRQLMRVRALVFSVAATTEGVGRIEETLKWGEPAYLTAETGSGSTIRLGCSRRSQAVQCALYFNCNTTLVDTFRSLFASALCLEGNRAIVFAPAEMPERRTLALCIGSALTYHRDRKKRRRRPG